MAFRTSKQRRVRKKRLANYQDAINEYNIKHQAVSEFIYWVGRRTGLNDKLLTGFKKQWLEEIKPSMSELIT